MRANGIAIARHALAKGGTEKISAPRSTDSRHLHQLDETGGAQRRDVIRVEDSAVPDGEDHEPAQTILKAPLPNARPRARKEVLVPGNAGSPQRVDQARHTRPGTVLDARITTG